MHQFSRAHQTEMDIWCAKAYIDSSPSSNKRGKGAGGVKWSFFNEESQVDTEVLSEWRLSLIIESI